jgi:aminopeptidase N
MSFFRHRRSRVMRAFVLAFVLLTSQFPAVSQQEQPAPPPQPPPLHWPRSHDYDVQHYRIEASFDWTRRSIKGDTTISLKPLAGNFKQVELDAGDMQIKSVTRTGGVPLIFRYEQNEKLFVTLDRAYEAGAPLAITVSYTATPKRGLTFITPSESDPRKPHQIWSQGEAESNHYWFPCYDHPNDKATTEMLATVEDSYQVVSNGTLVGVTPNPAKKTKTWHWKMDQPYSSYLISIIVGQYAEIKGQFKTIPVISNVYRDQVEEGRISFGKLPQMVAFYSEKLAYNYPYPKYYQTTVADFGGAMENITSTTMTDNAVHDRRAHLDVSSDEIVAHELAHSWFGNLLTCRDWSQIWLNESFATFLEAIWNEHDEGKDSYLYEMRGNQQAYFQTWAQQVRRPIVTYRYSNPDAVFDTYAYPRGAAVVNMMRFVLGEEMFWKAIRHYLKKHEWQNVETQQLVVAIEESTGQNLQWFIDEWVYKIGHPEFEITQSYDEGAHTLKLAVRQTQKPDEKRPWFESPDYFKMPVDVAVTTVAGERVHRVWIDKKEKEFSFPVDSKPLIVNFDRGNYLIKQVKFSRGDDELGYQLLNDTDVMGRVGAAIELKSSRSETALKALAEAARRDPFWGVRIEAVKSLSEIKNDGSRAALLEAARDKDSRIRRAAITGLAAFKDPKLAEVFINIIKNDESYFAIAEAARALGQSGAPQAFDVLVATLSQESWQDTIRAGVMSGLAELKDPRALDIAFKYAAPGNRPSVRGPAFQLIAALGKGNDRALQILTAALKEPSTQIVFNALNALGALGDQRAIPALEEFMKGPFPPGVPEEAAKEFIASIIMRIKNPEKPKNK